VALERTDVRRDLCMASKGASATINARGRDRPDKDVRLEKKRGRGLRYVTIAACDPLGSSGNNRSLCHCERERSDDDSWFVL